MVKPVIWGGLIFEAHVSRAEKNNFEDLFPWRGLFPWPERVNGHCQHVTHTGTVQKTL